MIAINIADLTRVPPHVAPFLLGDVARERHIAKGMEPGRVDDGALVLECDDERARAILEVLRMMDRRARRYLTRAYVSGPRGGWKKIG